MAAPNVTIEAGPVWQAHSDEVGDLMRALAKAQMAFGPVKKTKKVLVRTKTGGDYSYEYADLADILEVVRKPLNEFGLVLTSTIDDDKRLTTWLFHETGQWMRSILSLGDYNRPQDFGIDLTYSRRYMVSALLGIASEADTDGQGIGEESKPSPSAKPEPKPKPARATRKGAAKKPAPTTASVNEPPPADGDKITDAQRKKLWTTVRAVGEALNYEPKQGEALLRSLMESQKMGGEKHSTNMLSKKDASLLIEQLLKMEADNVPPDDLPLKGGDDEPEPGSDAAKEKVFD